MADIDYPRFARLLARCEELANAQGADNNVVDVYRDILKPKADLFVASPCASG
ncbi:MAG: hypothetical protein HYZ28_17660 [Myxococcales bacterium]|nr:hypothetical protein [Myxococcales bacterium]